MNNAKFKLECFKNGLYSREQILDFYSLVYKENTKFDKRDIQLWLNGKSEKQYKIDQTAIDMIVMLNNIRSEILETERERIKKGNPRYTIMFKNEIDFWNTYREMFNLPLNFYHSILIELQVQEIDYYENNKENIKINELHENITEQSVYFAN